MRRQLRNVTEHHRTISTRRSTRLENSLSIPIDLIIEILSRLPAKSIATCRCVSKLWDSVICRQFFTEQFLTRSLQRPQLLFSCRKNGKMFFFSSPQLQNPAENSSATSLMNFPFSTQISNPVHGLICLTHVPLVWEEMVIVICNPSTGQSLSLPKLRIGVTPSLVYEPIKKQFKVLLSYERNEHQVLTLGTGKLSWRKIQCSMRHIGGSEICINGVLYYQAITLPSADDIIVCFDVSSEKFSFITDMEDFIEAGQNNGTLINYNGKLASLVYSMQNIKLWILQDPEKQVWSKHTYVVPAWFEAIFGTASLHFLGVSRTNEIMLAQCWITVPFYVFYFSIETKTMRRVAMHGMEAFQYHQVFTFLDHVENVKLMDHMF